MEVKYERIQMTQNEHARSVVNLGLRAMGELHGRNTAGEQSGTTEQNAQADQAAVDGRLHTITEERTREQNAGTGQAVISQLDGTREEMEMTTAAGEGGDSADDPAGVKCCCSWADCCLCLCPCWALNDE